MNYGKSLSKTPRAKTAVGIGRPEECGNPQEDFTAHDTILQLPGNVSPARK